MAPPYVVEYCKVKINDAFKADPTIVNESLELLKKVDGAKKIYHGVEVQDPSTWWLLIEWETLTHHQTLMNDKIQYPILLTHIKSFSTSVKLWHVEFPDAPYTALEAPYTEVLLWSLKDGHKTAEAKEKALKDLGAIQEKFHGLDLKEAGISRGTLGPVVEESEAALALVLGWTSPEATTKAFNSLSESVLPLVGQLREVADMSLVHVPFVNVK